MENNQEDTKTLLEACKKLCKKGKKCFYKCVTKLKSAISEDKVEVGYGPTKVSYKTSNPYRKKVIFFLVIIILITIIILLIIKFF